MPSQGQPIWDCVFGHPYRSRRVLALPVSGFLKNTARNHQQKWRSKNRSWGKDAKYRRHKRSEDGDAVRIIDSQLLVAKKKLKLGTFWPPNVKALLSLAVAQKKKKRLCAKVSLLHKWSSSSRRALAVVALSPVAEC